MRLGLGSYSLAWAIGVPGHPPASPITALGFLHEACRLGVQVIQVCENLPLTRLAPRELNRFEAEARDAGISIELGTRGIAESNLRAHLGLAKRLRSPFLRVVLDHAGDEPTPEEAIRRLRPWKAAFSEAGVKLGVENHDRFLCATLTGIVRELGPDWVGICLDTVNSFGALEGPDTVVAQLAPYALSLHVKDFTVTRPPHQMGFVVAGCAAGEGRLQLDPILEALRAAGRDVNAILETWVAPGPDLEETIERERRWTERGIANLRRSILGTLEPSSPPDPRFHPTRLPP